MTGVVTSHAWISPVGLDGARHVYRGEDISAAVTAGSWDGEAAEVAIEVEYSATPDELEIHAMRIAGTGIDVDRVIGPHERQAARDAAGQRYLDEMGWSRDDAREARRDARAGI